MTPAGFEPPIPDSERPQTHTLDRAATGTCSRTDQYQIFYINGRSYFGYEIVPLHMRTQKKHRRLQKEIECQFRLRALMSEETERLIHEENSAEECFKIMFNDLYSIISLIPCYISYLKLTTEDCRH
jgi:hypothetical protein